MAVTVRIEKTYKRRRVTREKTQNKEKRIHINTIRIRLLSPLYFMRHLVYCSQTAIVKKKKKITTIVLIRGRAEEKS